MARRAAKNTPVPAGRLGAPGSSSAEPSLTLHCEPQGSENRLRAVLDALPAAVYTTDPDGRITHFNAACVELAGRTPQLGSDQWCVTWKLYYPDGRPMPHDECPMAITLREGRVVRGQKAIAERPDGTRVWFEPYPTPLFDGSGALIGAVNMLLDITERMRAEETLRERQACQLGQREALETALNGAPLHASLGVLVRTATQVLGNDTRAAFYLSNEAGTALHHVVGMSAAYAEAVDGFPIGLESLSCGLAAATGQSILTADVMTDPRWEGWRHLAERFDYRACWSFPIHVTARRYVGTLAIYWRQPREATSREIDIASLLTDTASAIIAHHAESEARARAEQALRGSEMRFRNMADSAPAMLRVTERDASASFLSRAWHEYTGQEEQESTGAGGFGWLEAVHPEDRERAERTLREASERQEAFSTDYRLRRADGEYRWCIDAGRPRFGADGEFLGYVGSVIDVHERKQAEHAANESQARLTAELADTKLLASVSAELVREQDVHALYDRLLDAAVINMRSDFASLQMLHPERGSGGELRLLASRGFDAEAAKFWEWVRTDSKCACGVALATGERCIVPDVLESDFMAGTAEQATSLQAGIRAVQSTPLLSRGGEIVGMVSTHWKHPHTPSERDLRLLDVLARQAADLIDRKRAEEALREADRRKDEFLAMLAHELRGPLAPLRYMLEVVKRAEGDGELLRHARETMDRQLGQMVRLVDDLLDVSRISRGRIELKRERVELASVLRLAVEACRPLAESAQLEVSYTLPGEAMHLHADAARLAQVFGNLLNNACKYSEPGSSVWLTVERQGGEAIVKVKDTGVGIPPEELSGIFEMFTQVDQSRARSQGGLGIGLTLVKRLVEMHGGSVQAFSEGVNRGSEFVVRLPLMAEESEATSRRPVEEERSLRRHILIVDDNVDSAASLALLLKMTGSETHTRHDGWAAVEAAEEIRPDVALLDIGLPKLNGYEACRRIRAQPWGKDIRLVALTGWGQEEDRRRSEAAGFDAHLVKPVDFGTLTKLLAEWRDG